MGVCLRVDNSGGYREPRQYRRDGDRRWRASRMVWAVCRARNRRTVEKVTGAGDENENEPEAGGVMVLEAQTNTQMRMRGM